MGQNSLEDGPRIKRMVEVVMDDNITLVEDFVFRRSALEGEKNLTKFEAFRYNCSQNRPSSFGHE